MSLKFKEYVCQTQRLSEEVHSLIHPDWQHPNANSADGAAATLAARRQPQRSHPSRLTEPTSMAEAHRFFGFVSRAIDANDNLEIGEPLWTNR